MTDYCIRRLFGYKYNNLCNHTQIVNISFLLLNSLFILNLKPLNIRRFFHFHLTINFWSLQLIYLHYLSQLLSYLSLNHECVKVINYFRCIDVRFFQNKLI